jgi:hypothetical protein
MMTQDHKYHGLGLVFIAASCWIMLMSESVLLSRIQGEMSKSLDSLRDKQHAEVQDLLYFLRQSKLSSSPLSSMDASVKFVKSFPFPAYIMSPSMGIVHANAKFSSLLGYKEKELTSTPVSRINNKVLMSEVGSLLSKPPYTDQINLSMRYIYKHKEGNDVTGSLHLVKIPDGNFFMLFLPDSNNIFSDNEIKNMLT